MDLHYILVDFENVQPRNMAALMGGPYRIKVFLGASQGKIPLDMARALQAFGPDAEYIQIDGSGSNALDFHIAYYMGKLATEQPGAAYSVVSRDKGFDPLVHHLLSLGTRCQRVADIAGVLGRSRGSTAAAAAEAEATDAPARGAKKAARKSRGAARTEPRPAARSASRTAEPTPAPAPRRRRGGRAAAEPAVEATVEAAVEPPTPTPAPAAKRGARKRGGGRKSAAAALAVTDGAFFTAVADNLARHAASRPRTLKTLRSMIKALAAGLRPDAPLGDAELDAVLEALVARAVIAIDGKKVGYPASA